MSALASLTPQPLWNFFAQFCTIPHPSKHEAALAAWIRQWAEEKGLSVVTDKVGNLIIKKPAHPEAINKPTVVLQAHLDMVPQKDADSPHDFLTDPIQPIIDGEWVRANRTTLGADNGVGAASCLAVLDSTDIKHGPVEVLLTIDEEAGMTGAFGLEPGLLEGQYLINTDSEDEGEIYMGCAGGINANIQYPINWHAPTLPHAICVQVSGLAGGHSGCDIHIGRGNANKLLTRLLSVVNAAQAVELANITGGSLRNAIPRDAEAVVLVADSQAAIAQIEATAALIKTELAATEPKLNIQVSTVEAPEKVMDANTARTLISALYATPNGVARMSDSVTGVVETSSNLGVVETKDDHVYILCLLRSLVDSCRVDLQQQIAAVWSLTDSHIEFDGAYPGWAPDNSSKLMHIVRDSYEQLFNKTPKIMVIHAGLECGLFKTAYPEMDMVSIGPTIRFPHSPDEKIEIATVDLYWKLLVSLLENIAD